MATNVAMRPVPAVGAGGISEADNAQPELHHARRAVAVRYACQSKKGGVESRIALNQIQYVTGSAPSDAFSVAVKLHHLAAERNMDRHLDGFHESLGLGPR